MELYREIRAFYIKLPYSYKEITQDVIDNLWNLSRELPISAIDINKNDEILMHAEMEFSLEHWNEVINYLRSSIALLNVKNGYIAVRKIIASSSAVKTEIEGYKVTKRGVYNSELPESPDFLEDIIKLSGRNKRLQQLSSMEKLFRFIEEQEKDKDEEKGS
ncbi:MAG TPA: hypothetical protein VF790_04305 [Dissulfurispiraceae bacterium]